MDDKYGWNLYRKDGLNELKRIAISQFFGNKSEQIRILNTYIDIYKSKKENEIKGTIFYPEEISQNANKRASKNIKEIRENIEEFYKTEDGKNTSYEIYFIAEKGDYKLGIRPKRESQAVSPSPISQNTNSISYNEHLIFETKYRPIFNIMIIFMAHRVRVWVKKSHEVELT